jgi:hypothetical protein
LINCSEARFHRIPRESNFAGAPFRTTGSNICSYVAAAAMLISENCVGSDTRVNTQRGPGLAV